MNTKFLHNAALAICLSIHSLHPLRADHHVLVIDEITKNAHQDSRLLLVDIETGKTLARADIGPGPQVGLSPKRDFVAVLTYNRVGGAYRPHARLEIFRTSDLRRLHSGTLPFKGGIAFSSFAHYPTLAISPDGSEVLIQREDDTLTSEKPVRMPFRRTLLSFVKMEVNEDGVFRSSRGDVKIPRSRAVDFLRLTDWPRVHIWNGLLAVVEVIDVSSGKILSRLPLDYEDDTNLKRLDPEELEKPEIGELAMHLGANGRVLGGDGKFCYYLPRPGRNVEAEPGYLVKVDLGADPPKVVKKGDKRQPGLLPPVAAVTESGGAIFAVVEKQNKGSPQEPFQRVPVGVTAGASSKIKVYSAKDLTYLAEIVVPLPACDSITVSTDGKYLYALNRLEAKLAVVEVASGQKVKILEKIAGFPTIVLALREAAGSKE